jgi:lipopolysaccharide transport system ATP-binding protein
MAHTSIQVDSIGKRYRLGGEASFQYRTLRDSIASTFSRKPSGEPDRRELWALRDVSFDVAEGEALGLIGPNGAGKSTLLKILSRITEPTEGKISLYGRVASLLEVGTGFHPELTGRENIYLNGAILGMKRSEITRDFDSIVEFAGIERFVDTPVKRYSSGMYVRLAFAVAAHLTPEILLVDEVLAVGDAEFQRRCLGRMSEVARSGRTVIFVSHNLSSIARLCPRTVLLDHGTVAAIGPSRDVIGRYLARGGGDSSWDLREWPQREGTGRAKIVKLEVLDATGSRLVSAVRFGEDFRLRIHFESNEAIASPAAGMSLLTESEERVFLSSTLDARVEIDRLPPAGSIDCVVKAPNVLPGTYHFEIWLTDVLFVSYADRLRMVGGITIEIAEGDPPELTHPDRGRVFVECGWEFGHAHQ